MFVCCIECVVGVRVLCGMSKVFVCCVERVGVRVLCREGMCSCVVWRG